MCCTSVDRLTGGRERQPYLHITLGGVDSVEQRFIRCPLDRQAALHEDQE